MERTIEKNIFTVVKKKLKKLLKKKNKLLNIYKKYKRNKYLYISIKAINIEIDNIKKRMKKKKEDIIYLEIRSGIGGEESCMFIKDIYKMYIKYFINNYIIYDIFYKKKSKKGIKRIIIRAQGKEIYKKLFNEIGVHRVQRVPKNDIKKRVHTSTCIIDIIKEYDEKDILFKRKDLKIDTFKSSGAGGQHVNKTNSAVRITHIPTNITVECQKERSQMENKKFAIKLLISKIKEEEEEKKKKIINEKRNKLKIKYSSRSSKIRTYNYSRNVIKDHIINKSFNNLKKIVKNGRIDKIFKKYN
ncbi:peptide chain release factor-like protein [Candidatus Vidania fulgoroideorum]